MNTRRTDARRVGEYIVNAGATPQGNRIPPQVHTLAIEQLSINPPAITDCEVRAVFFRMVQAITTQAQIITTQDNREIVPQENKHTSSMASLLRDFTRINPPMFFGCKVHEDPHDFLYEVYKILFAIG